MKEKRHELIDSRADYKSRYTGAALSAIGPFFEVDTNTSDPSGSQPIGGWPFYRSRFSFATISGFYDVQQNTSGTNYPWLNQYGWESFISGIPHPTALIFAFGANYLDAKVDNTTISNFKTKVTFKNGLGEWTYTWTPEANGTQYDIAYATFYSRERPNVVATKVTITASADASGTITDLLDGRSAALSIPVDSGLEENNTIHSSVHPLIRIGHVVDPVSIISLVEFEKFTHGLCYTIDELFWTIVEPCLIISDVVDLDKIECDIGIEMILIINTRASTRAIAISSRGP